MSAFEVRDFVLKTEFPGLQRPLATFHDFHHPKNRQQTADIPHLQQHPRVAYLLNHVNPTGEAAIRHQIRLGLPNGLRNDPLLLCN